MYIASCHREGEKDERRRRKEGKMKQRRREEERTEARRDSSSYHISIWVCKRDNHKLEVVQKSGYLWQHNNNHNNWSCPIRTTQERDGDQLYRHSRLTNASLSYLVTR